jgi:hypothetical protein
VKHSYRGAVVGGSIGLVFALAYYLVVGWVVLNPGRTADQVAVWNYTPTAEISAQIHRTDMSAEGKFLYLASRPTVDTANNFNSTCGVVTSDTSLLGCYLDDSQRAYIYRVTDPRLDGTEDIVAAHEMLRAAWDRMTPAERSRLEPPLDDIVAADPSNENLQERTTALREDDPTHRYAELYAIVGSEIANVGSRLEKSYDRYFTHRSVVTKLNVHANKYVIALQKKITALSATLTSLNKQIDTGITQFNQAIDVLNADIDSFNARADRIGGFASIGQFNRERAALIGRQRALQTTSDQIDAQITLFNKDLDTLGTLSKTAADLFTHLNNDQLAPLPTLSDA